MHELPAPDAIARIVEGLRASLFPVHFGLPELTDQSVDYYVGHTLDCALRALSEQIRRCLAVPGSRDEGLSDLDAGDVTRAFAAELPIIQGVTLGAKSFPVDANGVIIKGAERHPIIEDDVVSRGATIGGSSWVLESVPARAEVTVDVDIKMSSSRAARR